MALRKRRLILSLGALGSVAMGAYCLLQPREPEYQGKSLTAWIESASHGDAEKNELARKAVRAMGTNTLPFLLKMVRARDRPLEQTLDRLGRSLFNSDFGFSRAYETHMRAASGFACLEAGDALLALPSLFKLMEDPDPGVREGAFNCLIAANLDPATQREVLTKATNHFPEAVRWMQLLDQSNAPNQLTNTPRQIDNRGK